MSELARRSESVSRRLPWLLASISCALLGLGLAWSLAQVYPPLVSLALARVSGWLALLCLSCALCVSPLAHLSKRLKLHARVTLHAARLRRMIGMTSALLALLHAGLAWTQLHDAARGTLLWLVETPHLRAGLAALVCLLLLLLTSFAAIVATLRLRAWKELHRLAYLAFACAGQHVLLSPFAPRAFTLGLLAGTLLIGMLRWLPSVRVTGR